MQGKGIVITGATSGIGRATAIELARRGANVLITGRDPDRAEQTLAAMRQVSTADLHGTVLADMASLGAVKRMGEEILDRMGRIDILINNAGSWFLRPRQSEDGFERTFAVNHLAHFALTAQLLPRVLGAEEGRIITTASSAHYFGQLALDDLKMSQGLGGQRDYARSKLANVLFTRELATRLEGSRAVAVCFHPGFVETNLGMNNPLIRPFLFVIFKLFGLPVEEGARTAVYLATAPREHLQPGAYYVKKQLVTPSAQARDSAAAERLWELSESLTGVRYDLPSPPLRPR